MVKLIIVILMKEIVKRHYVKPHMAVYYIESPQLLAGSGTGTIEEMSEETFNDWE